MVCTPRLILDEHSELLPFTACILVSQSASFRPYLPPSSFTIRIRANAKKSPFVTFPEINCILKWSTYIACHVPVGCVQLKNKLLLSS